MLDLLVAPEILRHMRDVVREDPRLTGITTPITPDELDSLIKTFFTIGAGDGLVTAALNRHCEWFEAARLNGQSTGLADQRYQDYQAVYDNNPQVRRRWDGILNTVQNPAPAQAALVPVAGQP